MSLSVAQLVVDCADAARLAAFWSQALDRPVDPGANENFATIGPSHGHEPGTDRPLSLMFLRVPETKQVKNRLHLDLAVRGEAGWRDEVDRLLALGATLVKEHKEFGWHWMTLLDPEGNEFDLGAGAAEPDA